jgi:predicted component of type VI protein secretion system
MENMGTSVASWQQATAVLIVGCLSSAKPVFSFPDLALTPDADINPPQSFTVDRRATMVEFMSQ